MKSLVKINSKEVERLSKITTILDKFLSSQDVRPSSRDLYKRTLRQYFKWINDNNLVVAELSREDIIVYKQYLLDNSYSSLTVSSYITAVRKFYEWAEAEKLYPNIAKGIKTPKRYKGFKKDPLTVEQIKELLESMERNSLQGKRDFAILNLMIRTGLRTIEVIRANMDDINYKSGEMVLYVHGKGRDSKDSFVLLTEKAYKPILEYLEVRGKTRAQEPLFTSLSNNSKGDSLTTRSISQIAKTNLKGIGLNSGRLTAHSLRHTAGVNVLRAGGDLYSTQLFMRHSDPATTQLYLKSIEEEHRLKNAPEKLLDSVF